MSWVRSCFLFRTHYTYSYYCGLSSAIHHIGVFDPWFVILPVRHKSFKNLLCYFLRTFFTGTSKVYFSNSWQIWGKHFWKAVFRSYDPSRSRLSLCHHERTCHPCTRPWPPMAHMNPYLQTLPKPITPPPVQIPNLWYHMIGMSLHVPPPVLNPDKVHPFVRRPEVN